MKKCLPLKFLVDLVDKCGILMLKGGLMSTRKRFDSALYEENDKLAKEFVKNILKGSEFQVIENPKKRDVDLLLYRNSEHVANIECEIKRVWKEKEFPYESIQIPDRKTKYTKLTKPTIFVMLNNDQTAYVAIPQQTLLASPKKEVPNKYVFSGEMFYQVPKDSAHFNGLLAAIKEALNEQ